MPWDVINLICQESEELLPVDFEILFLFSNIPA